MNINLEEEISEFRAFKYVKEMIVESFEEYTVRLTTLEDVRILAKWTQAGVIILESSEELPGSRFDDLTQLLNSISPGYRACFANSLFSKLNEISE
jgi:hypothetical protein